MPHSSPPASMEFPSAMKRKDPIEAQFLQIIADEHLVLTAPTRSKRDKILQKLEAAGFLEDADGMYSTNYYTITSKGRRAILK